MVEIASPDKSGHGSGHEPDTRNTDSGQSPLPPFRGEGLSASFVRLVCPVGLPAVELKGGALA